MGGSCGGDNLPVVQETAVASEAHLSMSGFYSSTIIYYIFVSPRPATVADSTTADCMLMLRLHAVIIGHARIKYVGEPQPCMVTDGRINMHASYMYAVCSARTYRRCSHIDHVVRSAALCAWMVQPLNHPTRQRLCKAGPEQVETCIHARTGAFEDHP